MSFIVNEPVERYAEEHTTPVPELFRRLAAETREKSERPQMMVGLLEGRFLGLLVRQTGRERTRARHVHRLVVDLDGERVDRGGRITTCDVDEETTAMARRYAEEAGVADRIDYRLGPA